MSPKPDARVAIRVPGKRAGTFTTSVTTWGATVPQILELIEFLRAQQVTTVVMEATGDYWKPFYFLMEDTLPVTLVNARQARNIPGRKTDVSDAASLAQLPAHGLLRASFVPPEPTRQLRDLTRARAVATADRTRQVHRLEKFLESTGIKLSSVAFALTGASSRAMLDALIAGERDPQVLRAREGHAAKQDPATSATLATTSPSPQPPPAGRVYSRVRDPDRVPSEPPGT